MSRLKVSSNAADFLAGLYLAPIAIIALLLLVAAPIYGIYTATRIISEVENVVIEEGFIFGIIGAGINILATGYAVGASISCADIGGREVDSFYYPLGAPRETNVFQRLFFPVFYLSTIALSITLCVKGFTLLTVNALTAGICFIAYFSLGFLLLIAAILIAFVFYR